jgi:glutamine synthetase
MNTNEIVENLQERGIKRVKVGGFDIDGVLRGKYISLSKLRSALEHGFGFCDVIFGWDISDKLYDNGKVTGAHTGYPDALAILDPSTLRDIPWEPGVVAMLADFRDEQGNDHPGCPRSLCRKVLKRAESLGFSTKIGFEFEFWFFKESSASLEAKGYRNLIPVTPGMFGYSWLRAGQQSELMQAIFDEMEAFGIEIEGLHTETGPGVYEAALRYDEGLKAVDKAALFKTSLKQIASRFDLSVTFMAKWNADLPGSSGHIHQSLWKGTRNAFANPEGLATSELAVDLQQYVAGQLAMMRDFTALISPTINSYKRYVPGVWAPMTASWAIENRTCALRVLEPHHAKAARVEVRQGAADINPYLGVAASLAAGLYGMEKQLQLPEASSGDASQNTDPSQCLPATLAEATRCLKESELARELLGEEFVDHYVRTREWEVRQYQRAVSDWELRRYFEGI